MKTKIKLDASEVIDAVKMYVRSTMKLETFSGDVKFFVSLHPDRAGMPVSGDITAEFNIE